MPVEPVSSGYDAGLVRYLLRNDWRVDQFRHLFCEGIREGYVSQRLRFVSLFHWYDTQVGKIDHTFT